MDLAGLSETNGTLLVADWKELRSSFSIKEIMRFNEDGYFDRTICALEIISQRKRGPENKGDNKKWYKTFCGIIAGAGVILGIILAAVNLYDRFIGTKQEQEDIPRMENKKPVERKEKLDAGSSPA